MPGWFWGVLFFAWLQWMLGFVIKDAIKKPHRALLDAVDGLRMEIRVLRGLLDERLPPPASPPAVEPPPAPPVRPWD